jgi:LCP family protein required for cell wall assembly
MSYPRRPSHSSGSVAVDGGRGRYSPLEHTVSSGGRTSTVYGQPNPSADDHHPVKGGRPNSARTGPMPGPGGTGPVRSGGTGAVRSGGTGPVRSGGGGPGAGQPPKKRAGTAQSPAGVPPKTRRKDPVWARLLVLAGAMLMMLSGATIVGGKALMLRATSAVNRVPLLGAAGIEAGPKGLTGPLNILLVGIDERPEGQDLVRADSILILNIPANHRAAYLFAVPRDAFVEIPAYQKTGFRGGQEKINGAFAHGWANGGGREGGFELLALTVQRLTGLRFNAGAIVDFNGFESIVKAFGGVDMCVDTTRPVTSEHVGFDSKGNYRHPREGGKPQVYNPGCRRFSSWEALDYVRQRKSLDDGDYGRARHQQQFLKAMAKEAKKQNVASNPKKLYEIIQAAGKTLTVDTRGVSIEDWVFTLRNVADSDLVMLKANGGKFHPIRCGDAECEGLAPENLVAFKAMREDTMAEFTIAHPDFINS